MFIYKEILFKTPHYEVDVQRDKCEQNDIDFPNSGFLHDFFLPKLEYVASKMSELCSIYVTSQSRFQK